MTWFKPIGTTEGVFVVLFIVAYLLYLLRLFKIARRLHTTFRPLIFKTLLRTLAFAFLIIALLGPSFGETTKEVKSEGKIST